MRHEFDCNDGIISFSKNKKIPKEIIIYIYTGC